MTYDLAVWEGAPPSDDDAAGNEHERLYRLYIEPYFDTEATVPPTDGIRAFVADLLARWPDLDGTDDDDDRPWANGPLLEGASGPYIYFTMMYSMAEAVSAYCVERAIAHGLVCYDINQDRLRTEAAG
ncbi:hypothetical protein ACWIGW_39870 [Nocardia brasiliensis]